MSVPPIPKSKVTKIRLKKTDPHQPAGIDSKFYLTEDPGPENVDVLVVSFSGEYPDGSLGNQHADYMKAITVYGLVSFDPDAIVLDFRDLSYRWGNSIFGVFQAISQMCDQEREPDEPCFPVAIAASEKCMAGLSSLLVPADADRPENLFDDLDKAILHARKKAREWLDY